MAATQASDPELIHVGLPHLSDSRNGLVKARAEDGLLCLTVEGFGRGELYMDKESATALRDQLNNAINSL